jgi:hypothetical protein
MVDVLEVRGGVVNFREEASGCLRLAKAEAHSEVRAVLMGMAVGWLELAHHTKSSGTLQLEPADIRHGNG